MIYRLGRRPLPLDAENDRWEPIGSTVEWEDSLGRQYKVDFYGPNHEQRSRAYMSILETLIPTVKPTPKSVAGKEMSQEGVGNG